jgi:hypothetical protein
MNVIEEILEDLVSGLENLVQKFCHLFLRALEKILELTARALRLIWLALLVLAGVLMFFWCLWEMGSADMLLVRWSGRALFVVALGLLLGYLPGIFKHKSEVAEGHGLGWRLFFIDVLLFLVLSVTNSFRSKGSFVSSWLHPRTATVQDTSKGLLASEPHLRTAPFGRGTLSDQRKLAGRLPCSSEEGLKSQHQGVPVNVTIRNGTPDILEVFWINYQGTRVAYNKLGPGESYVQPTFQGHAWLLAGPHGLCKVLVVATPDTRQISAK